MQSRIRSLDPALSNDQYSHQILAQVYEGLMSFHYLKRPLQIEPLLADGWPTISSDGLTYEFKIKKGVFFHDHPSFPNGKGREITAHDFIYSWKRISDPKNKSESFWVFEKKIRGLDQWRSRMAEGKANYQEEIEGLVAKDSHTLVIKLTEPYYQLLYVLAMAMTVVVPQEVANYYGAEFGNYAIGTGPFILQKWIRGFQLTYLKNPNYNHMTYPTEGSPGDKESGWLDDAGKKLPLIDKLVIYEIQEDQPRWLMFLKGDLDFILCPKDFMSQVLNQQELAPNFKNKNMKLELPSSADVVYISFNTENPYLKNKKIRQALSLAYNRATSHRDFYNSLGTLAHGPIPPNFEGYDSNNIGSYSKFDLQKSKQLLIEAGFPEGKGLPTLQYEMGSANSTERQMAEYFKIQMAQIGINIEIHSNTWPQFTEKIKKKQADIFMMAWNADYPDAENFLQLFYGPNLSPGPNNSNFKNQKYDELYTQAKKLPPGLERSKIYHQMENLLMEESPWIFLIHRSRVALKQSWIKNYRHEQMIKNGYKYIRINADERARSKVNL